MNYARKLFRLLVVLFALPLFSGCDSDDPGSSAAPPPMQFQLTVGKLGTGSGTVTSVPAGTNCGANCQSYDQGTSVTLTAAAGTGDTFAGWGGACASAGANPSCPLTINAATSVTATFNAPSVGEIIALATPTTGAQKLISFNRATPGTIVSTQTIAGLQQATELVVGIDRRSNNTIYALTSGGTTQVGTATRDDYRLYTLNPASGAATFVAALSADPEDLTAPFDPAVTLDNATAYALDFNPVADRLRVVTNDGKNLRINPGNGQTITDAELTQMNVAAAAYTNNFAGATVTSLYVIDAAGNQLYLQNPPNDGTTAPVGAALGAGIASGALQAFDIQGGNVDALAVAANKLYLINVGTGSATELGTIAAGTDTVTGLALPIQAAPPAVIGEAVALTQSERLVSFNLSAPGTFLTSARVTGLASGEKLVGIDVRPASATATTFTVYALGNNNGAGRLYTVDVASGVLTQICTLGPAPSDTFSALAGTDFGADFNPVPDRLRLISDTGQNLRINPTPAAGGACEVTTDSALNQTNLTGAAYTNGFDGAQTTTLYVINTTTDILARLGADPATAGACPGDAGNPNCGTVTNLGALNVGDVTAVSGFDIDSRTGLASAILTVAGVQRLYSLDLATGAATAAADFPVSNDPVKGFTQRTQRRPEVFAVRTAGGSQILSTFQFATPGTVTDIGTITGLQSGETVLGIDFRPADGLLYALGSGGNVYRLPIVAPVEAEMVSALQPAAGGASPDLFASLNGATFGVDFNPVVDRLRVVSNANQNLRVNVNTGETLNDLALARPPFKITGAAYNNNVPNNTAAATLYVLDTAGGNLMTLDNPSPPGSNGRLTLVGSLNLPSGSTLDFGVNGFEILGTGTAVAALPVSSTQSALYSVNLTSGALSLVGNIGVNEPAVGLAAEVAADPPAGPNPSATLTAVTDAGTSGNRLIRFNRDAPGTLLTNLIIPGSGLQANEKILAIDFFDATEDNLIALGDGGAAGVAKRLYTINTTSAAASSPVTLTADPTDTSAPYTVAMLEGVKVAMDFDTRAAGSTLRLITESGVNMRVNRVTGVVTTDTALNRTTPRIAAAAYSSNFAGGASTTLYVLNVDGTNDALMIQNPPNDGTLKEVNLGLGPNFTDTTAFDILGGHNGLAIAATDVSGGDVESELHHINLSTGAASKIGEVGPGAGTDVGFVVTAIALRYKP